MASLFQPLLNLLAGADDSQLRAQIQFFKVQDEILRSKLPKYVSVTGQERERLVRFGKPPGSAVNPLLSIVTPRTFARWLKPPGKTSDTTKAKVGRPRTDEEIRDLILKFARETSWGYTRILGELKKLGLAKVSRSTVVNICREHGLETGPRRRDSTWIKFVKCHAATLLACDFFSKKIVTCRGLVEYFVLFFIHVGTRKIFLAGMTAKLTQAWVAEQARQVSVKFMELPQKPTILLRDHDGKFSKEFDQVFKDQGIEVKPVGPHVPNMNAHAERWVESFRQEALDHFIVFGEAHLRHICESYVEFYNTHRPHQSLDNEPLARDPPQPQPTASAKKVVCQEFLGGLLKHYSLAA